MVKLTAIQLCSAPDVDENLKQIEQQLNQLEQSDTHLVVLPECCLYFGGSDKEQLKLAQQTALTNQLQEQLAALAKKYQITLVAGSIPVLSATGDKFFNTCCVYSANGELLSSYQKIHLFDVEVADKEKNYQESRFTSAGQRAVTVEAGDVTLGLSICYDLRFPELFRNLRTQGAQIITVPSAFTKVTGKAHWLTLLKARAIENQVYIVAAGQSGVHQNGRETWGHSVIIDPWGEVLAEIEHGVGTISADFENNKLQQVRQAIPVELHNQFTTKLMNDE